MSKKRVRKMTLPRLTWWKIISEFSLLKVRAHHPPKPIVLPKLPVVGWVWDLTGSGPEYHWLGWVDLTRA
ncbi:hypothetical protein PanWU01x14_128880 [Parasponia andersonii]|uniref:Uncharacterized protein n=1 Tax=Parasponia andersonii TaxID=3476 RepID=A0A2P5CRU5_PARAD|nr:hypothetical protein PanWU01x14_128880 [Parasponia andersonii]